MLLCTYRFGNIVSHQVLCVHSGIVLNKQTFIESSLCMRPSDGCFFFFFLAVFVSARGLSPVAASGGHSSSRCAGLSLSRPLLLRSAGSVVVAHGLSCSTACGIFPDQGSNPFPLHWQADSQPLRHQGSPGCFYMMLHLILTVIIWSLGA